MRIVYSFILILTLGLTSQAALADTTIMGRVETGLVSAECIELRIRMDTGAKTSSLSAHKISVTEKNGRKWVSFVLDPDRTTQIHRFELPLVRMVKIRKRAAEAAAGENFEHRPIVMMPVTIGKQTHEIEVSLANRSYFNYGMLLGRTAMEQFNVMIDPKVAFSQHSICPSEKKRVD